MNIRWSPSLRKLSLFAGRKKTEVPLSRKVEERLNALRKEDRRVIGRSMAVSPAEDMSGVMCLVGWLARAFVLFSAIYGTTLFLCDAARLVELTNKRPTSEVTLETTFLLVTAALLALFFSACAWNRLTRVVLPIAGLGGAVLYFVNYAGHPIRFAYESLRMTADVTLNNLAEIGYTAYVKYCYEGVYQFAGWTEELVKHGVAIVMAVYGVLFAAALLRRVRPVLVGLLLVSELVPVFMFNITATNKGFGWVLVTLCGMLCLYLYDRRYDIGTEKQKARAALRAAKKAEKKAAKLAKKEQKKHYKANRSLAYLTVIRDGGSRKEAIAARKKVEKDEAERIQKEKLAAAAAIKTRKADAKAAKLAAKKAKKDARTAASASRKAISKDKAALADKKAADRAKKANAWAAKKTEWLNKLAQARKKRLEGNKKIAGGGFVGVMAMAAAFLAIWLPYTAVEENFPIIDAINNRMQIARMYVTAYLMGDDVDLNSLSLYGGVSELNPRTVSFDSPQFTGQRIFTADAGYAAPVYLRSWMGMNYDLETDSWTSADAEQVLAYRSQFGSTYTPDSITTSFNGYVYPKSVDILRFDQYRNLDAYGFRVFQVNLRRAAGSSKLLFVPAVMNTNLKIMEHGSIEPIDLKYSAYYDGIYSSRFFGVDDGYSTSSFIPVMKDPAVGANMEKSIDYYNRALALAEQIETVETALEQGIPLTDAEGFEYVVTNGEEFYADWSSMIADYESWAKNDLAYRWDGDNLLYRYLSMEEAEQKTLWRNHEKELAYRNYAMETYTDTFGSEAIAELAEQILADAGIAMTDRNTAEIIKLDPETEEEYIITVPDIAESWFVDAATGEEVPRHTAIMAVIDYLRDNYTYTLEPDVPTVEVIDEEGNVTQVPNLSWDSSLEAFLFEVKEGYCVHFATSAVGLLRELGFAVRYTEGYIADNFTRTYAADAVARYRSAVRDNDAHAWVEVYYPDMGWIQYETTPSFCEAIYDEDYTESSSGSSSSSGGGYLGGMESTETEEEELVEEEEDYTKEILICIAVVVGILVLFSLVSWVLKKRAEHAADKRDKLVRMTEDRHDYIAGRVDIHQTARAIIDCIFAVFRGLGRPNELGEQPTEYAARLSEEFGSLSNHSLTQIMEIIEREEFGGTLSWQDLHTLGKYMEDLTKGAYAGLNWRQKIRMRYLLALL
ncbi:MAG: transglutaminase domain-containing protein [Ruminococcaceae bacterium]|nr:transglutaminase domain-containing protein [Oscillospiraceae bacterium]